MLEPVVCPDHRGFIPGGRQILTPFSGTVNIYSQLRFAFQCIIAISLPLGHVKICQMEREQHSLAHKEMKGCE